MKLRVAMGNLHVRLMCDLSKKNKIYRHNSKEHLKFCKIAKFGWQMLLKTKKYRIARLPKFVYVCITHGKSYHFAPISPQRWKRLIGFRF